MLSSRRTTVPFLLGVVLQLSGGGGVLASEPQCPSPSPTVSSDPLPDRNRTCWPDAWEGRTLEDLRKQFHCNSSEKRPIYDQAVWMMLRGVYQGMMGPERSTIMQPLSAEGGFVIDFDIRHTPDKGRGVFTRQPIKKGDLVHTSTRQWSHFSTGSDFRRFLQAIPPYIECGTFLCGLIGTQIRHSL